MDDRDTEQENGTRDLNSLFGDISYVHSASLAVQRDATNCEHSGFLFPASHCLFNCFAVFYRNLPHFHLAANFQQTLYTAIQELISALLLLGDISRGSSR